MRNRSLLNNDWQESHYSNDLEQEDFSLADNFIDDIVFNKDFNINSDELNDYSMFVHQQQTVEYFH